MAERSCIVMTEYDSREIDAATGQERLAQQQVSLKDGYGVIAPLHQEISKLWQESDVGSLKYLQARALRQDLQ